MAIPICAMVLAINSLKAAVKTSCIIPMPITSALGLISINNPLTHINITAANGMLHKPSQVISNCLILCFIIICCEGGTRTHGL